MAIDKSGVAKKPDPRSARLAEAQRRAKALAGSGKAPKNAGEAAAGFQQALKDHWTELKKVSWPSQEVLTKSTIVVLALVGSVAVWVGGLDFALGRLEKLFPSIH